MSRLQRASGLAPCPQSPNCVCSDATDTQHQVAALTLAVPPEQAWRATAQLLESLPRTTVVESSPGYLRAECRTRLLRFVDDLELQLRPEAQQIAVRSASRVGHSDLGVNRRRVEGLRRRLAAQGIVAPGD